MMEAPENTVLPLNANGQEQVAFHALSSVCKIHVSSAETDYINYQDLNRGPSKYITNGVAIDTKSGPRLLTTASGLVDEAFLQVQRNESDQLYVATVYARCIDGDLALIAVKDPKFWKNLDLIPIADTPSLRAEVLIAGFEPKGNELSVTKGVVSRIESQLYVLSKQVLPAITVDASTQQSGSSAVVFNNSGELVGLRVQILEGASNVALVVPPPVLHHFLQGIARFGVDRYKGTPCPGVLVQQLTNPYLREYLRLSPDVCGVLVKESRYGHSCHGVLQPRDVITHIGDKQVSNTGLVPFNKHGRIHLISEFAMHQCGDKVSLRIIRDGKPLTLTVTAQRCGCLVKDYYERGELAYVQWAGLVFRKLTLEYLEASNAGDSPYLWHLCFQGECTKNVQSAIVLSQVMSDTVNAGYESLLYKHIVSVNGHTIKNLDDLLRRINSALTKLVRFETVEGDVIAVPSPLDPASADMMKRIDQKYAPAPIMTETLCCTML